MGKTKNIGSIRISGAHKHANGDVSIDYEGPVPTMVGALKRGGVEVTGMFNPYSGGEFDAREANVTGSRMTREEVEDDMAEERAANASGIVQVLFDPFASERDEKGRIPYVEGNDSCAASLYENSKRNNASISILVAQGLMSEGVPVMEALKLAGAALHYASTADIVMEGDERPASWAEPDKAWFVPRFVPRQATDGCNATSTGQDPEWVRKLNEAGYAVNAIRERVSFGDEKSAYPAMVFMDDVTIRLQQCNTGEIVAVTFATPTEALAGAQLLLAFLGPKPDVTRQAAPLMTCEDVESRLRSYIDMRNRLSELKETRATIIEAKREDDHGQPVRRFYADAAGDGPFDTRRIERFAIPNDDMIDMLEKRETTLVNELLDMGVDPNRF